MHLQKGVSGRLRISEKCFRMFVFFLLLLVGNTAASPHMCHCANGQLGMQCPQPMTFNCPPPAPCHPFPSLPTISPGQTLPGLGAFTLAPFTPLPTIAPSNGQGLLSFRPQQPRQPLPFSQPPPLPPVQRYQQPEQAAAQQYAEVTPPSVIDHTTVATTLKSERYVEADNPERTDGETTLFENQPNAGYRQPVRRDVKTEIYSDKCNDERLKRIIEQNVDSNASTSKRKIQKAASEEIGGLFDVVCSSHDFSYLANTQLFCEGGNDEITCFAFMHSLIQ